jgi:hypothetical protein
MTHWHVTRHSEDDDPYVTDSLYDALDYAAGELDPLAGHEHDMITASGEAGNFEEAYKSFVKTETLAGLQANAANIQTQARSEPADRAPLYSDDTPYDEESGEVNTASRLYGAAQWVAENINEGSPLFLWQCEAETAYVTDTGEPAHEDDPNAQMTCTTYL